MGRGGECCEIKLAGFGVQSAGGPFTDVVLLLVQPTLTSTLGCANDLAQHLSNATWNAGVERTARVPGGMGCGLTSINCFDRAGVMSTALW